MPLGRKAFLIALLIALGSLAFAEGSGGGGGGPAPLPGEDQSNPAVPPGEAGEKECASSIIPPGPKGEARARALLAEDRSREPDANIVGRELCLVFRKATAYSIWAFNVGMKSRPELCAATPEVLGKWKHWAGEAAHLREILKKLLPYGMAALDAGDPETEGTEHALGEAEAHGRLAAAKVGLIANQCAYGKAKLDDARAAKAFAAVEKRLGGKADPARLDKAFDNAAGRKGGAVPVGGSAPLKDRRRLPAPASRPNAIRAAKTPAPESFKSLTAGIVPESGGERVSKRERRRREEILDQALRHIYSIPEGKKVLRDLQEARRLKGEELEKDRPRIEREILAHEKQLDTLIRARTELEKQPSPEPTARLLGENRDPAGEIDRVEPYLSLEECPKGQRPVVVDFPNPGDRACRPGTEKPALFAVKENKLGEFDLGEKVTNCPDGHTPVLTNHPHAGDRSCRPPDDPEMVKSIGPGPYHYVGTDNPFQPYRIFDKCPDRSQPVLSNWPKPGDISCLGPGSFGSVAELRKKIEEQKKKVEVNRIWLKASDKGALPRIGVEFGGTGPLEGGHAQPTLYRLMAYEDGSAAFTTPVRISPDFLRDGNPSRAVDKLLVHEFRHTADKALFEAADASQTRWMIGEDRAYLAQSRAVMEQKPAMRGERRSRIVDNMTTNLVESTIRDPKSVRLDRLGSPLYLWHATHADLDDPKTGLHGRLEQLYAMLAYSDPKQRAAVFAETDRTGELAAAFQRTLDAKLETANVWDDRRRALFLELASSTRAAQTWVDGIERLKRAETAPGKPAAWKDRFHRMENEYWKDLEDFSSRYARK
ncbi:MAG: hypothetical protein AUJ52_14580 [Elusimicrobia bacterium CG1_02_63_36]|nr:MAG: hypothetical protein AUJ52_14580 [Elusimicrobia bacterium CG1_02_63_36]